ADIIFDATLWLGSVLSAWRCAAGNLHWRYLSRHRAVRMHATRCTCPLFFLSATGAVAAANHRLVGSTVALERRLVPKQKGRLSAAFSTSVQADQKPMPPPMPPPGGIAGAGSFGNSATIASVVTSKPATEAASCRAARTTLAGSTMPLSIIST